jgi:cytochrome P450
MMRAPAVGPITFIRGVRSRGFLHFAGDLWREHGDVFEAHVGPRRLVFVMHPDAVEQVTVSGRQRYDKGESYDVVRKYLIGQGLVGSTGDLWRRQRKLMAPFFTPRGVATYADLVIRESLRFAERWEELADERREVDLSEEMVLITASIILKTMFSSEAPESIAQMKSAVETMITYVDSQMVPVRVPTWVPSRRNRRYFKARDLVRGSITALIAERRAIHETEWPNDLLSRLMEARDPDTREAMTETLLRDESITMFFAGHETTARTMAAAWYALGTHPEVAARLHQELDSILGDHAPTVEELHHLPYTLPVVKEGPAALPSGAFLRAGRHPGRPDRWLRRAVRGHDHALAVLHPPASRLLDRSLPLRPRSVDTGCRGHPSWALLPSLRSRPADLHRQQLLAAREPPAARDPRATLPPAPARWVRTALRHARHAEHRGRPACRDRDEVIRCFVGARRARSLVGNRMSVSMTFTSALLPTSEGRMQ